MSYNELLKCCREFSFQHNGLYYIVNLVVVAKLHSTFCEKREVKFQMAHRGQTDRVYRLVYFDGQAVEHLKRYYSYQIKHTS